MALSKPFEVNLTSVGKSGNGLLAYLPAKICKQQGLKPKTKIFIHIYTFENGEEIGELPSST